MSELPMIVISFFITRISPPHSFKKFSAGFFHDSPGLNRIRIQFAACRMQMTASSMNSADLIC